MGEKQGDREAMDRMTARILKNVPDPRKAEQMARESMVRVDRKLRDEGKR